jgi:hypothetical protein
MVRLESLQLIPIPLSDIQEYYGNDGCNIDIPYDEYNNNVNGNGNFLLDGSTSTRRIC